MPFEAEYRWLCAFAAASWSFATATSGDGRSGLPKPRSTTSSPARRSSSVRSRIVAKTYGGSESMRRRSISKRRSVPDSGLAPDSGPLLSARRDAWHGEHRAERDNVADDDQRRAREPCREVGDLAERRRDARLVGQRAARDHRRRRVLRQARG